MLQQATSEESVHAVATLPPPAGENDLYSAQTRLNVVPLYMVAEMMSDDVSAPAVSATEANLEETAIVDDAVDTEALLADVDAMEAALADAVEISIDVEAPLVAEPSVIFDDTSRVEVTMVRMSPVQTHGPSRAVRGFHAALFGASIVTLGVSILVALGVIG